MAVSMPFLLKLAMLLLWFRFFGIHVKAYIYVMYLEKFNMERIQYGWSCVQTSEAIDRSHYHRQIESGLIKLSR